MKNLKTLLGRVLLAGALAFAGLPAFGQNLDLPGNIIAGGAITATGQIIGAGTATNDNACTGCIGEFVSAHGFRSRPYGGQRRIP